MTTKRKAPVVLIVLDGFGEAPPGPGNAITLAEPRFWYALRERWPSTTLQCSGEDVGLRVGLMGNSEVGHLNIGAGRIVWQEITRIDRAIRTGEFFANPALVGAARHAREHGTTLHLMGLVSDGGVHSSEEHLKALLELAQRERLGSEQIVLHAFLDGRDTPPRSAERYLNDAGTALAQHGGRIGTIAGRYYAMDRDRRWDRVQLAYDALTRGIGEHADGALEGLRAAYARGESDEFVRPTIVGARERGRLRDGDAAIYFNFRADRARQLTAALTQQGFDGFERGVWPRIHMATMVRYRDDFDCPVAFAPQPLSGILPVLVSRAGLTQLRIAETEKYAHVTFFFSGGDEKELPGERRILVPSPKVATYDQQPQMSADEVTDRLLAELASPQRPDVVILNFANADMVGHTGDIPATIAAIRTIDACLARIVPQVLALGGVVAITADHGNAEMMVDPETGQPHTAHTTNRVPFLLAGPGLEKLQLHDGRLCDIAPTLLPFLGLAKDPAMEGIDLCSR